jgi:hypothetical protein
VRGAVCLTAVAAAAAGLLAPATAGAELRRPSGTYSAPADRWLLNVAGRSIQIAAFDFICRDTKGRISVNGIRIRRARGRWRFSARLYGLVTYADERPDENGRLRVTGRFSRNARLATGTLRVTAPSCGTTREQQWRASRRAGGVSRALDV